MTERYTLIPVCREIMADLDTPVGAYLKLSGRSHSFLLESIEGGEKWGRYSFIGCDPSLIIRSRDTTVEIVERGNLRRVRTDDPLSVLKGELARYRPVEFPWLPRFFGGGVGYLGYDMIRFFEKLPTDRPRTIGAWDSYMVMTDTLVIFDTMSQTVKVVANAHIDGSIPPEDAYREAIDRIDRIVSLLRRPLVPPPPHPPQPPARFESNMTRDEFEAAVGRAKEYVRSGDIIQVVLSQRFTAPSTVPPFSIYRVLRTLNPSPYLFYLDFDDTVVLGASPEVMVRKEGNRVELRPIAGTRPRGRTPEEDRLMERELLADPKERAEHVMLVDLGRNDLARVCDGGSVRVSELMTVERYSHVMHIVSNVVGNLSGGNDPFSLIRAAFPAGTLSGAPKIRAMEIIDELEPVRREIYGGAVGYISFSGNMDLAITIRTLVVREGKVHLQAGAGIVADSDPSAEWQETVNKAAAVRRAVEIAEAGLE
ncbi:MAG: anthranilate synthase component I [Desulfuromonadia bacterium]